MGKIAKPKASSKSQSVRSRAARRAVSPSVDVDKSLTSLPRPESPSTPEHSVLSTQHGSGISKKKSKQKPKSRAQRRRQEKGMERAEAIMDRTENKVTKSTVRGKNVKARRATWDEMNAKITSHIEATQPVEGEKAPSKAPKKDITLEEPEQSHDVNDTEELNPTQNSVSNEALDLDEDEEIT